ncbi:MAG: hypothetical protein O3C40_22215 [Planctomycetota bacterium]|nr:hypothetical protein [Planctomycetota bacterium]
MTRRRTFSDIAFAADTDNPDLPVEWAKDVAVQVLEWTWQAFDQLRVKHFQGVDFSQPLDQLERDLTRHHYVDLQIVFHTATEGFCSLFPEREWDEMESRSTSQAKPPAYDFAFVHIEHRRWAWPIEAKVVKTPKTLGKYVNEIHTKFMGGVAAPLVGEAGMIAYLLSGSAEKFLENLEKPLATALEVITEFSSRPHRTSTHPRPTAPTLRLHHMVMACH